HGVPPRHERSRKHPPPAATADDQASGQTRDAAPASDVLPRVVSELPARLFCGPLAQPTRAPPLGCGVQQLLQIAVGEVLLAPSLLLANVLSHPQLEIGLRHLGLATRAPALVVGGEHLLEILRLERLARFDDLSGGPQPDLLESGARIEPAEQPDRQHHYDDAA